MKRREVYTSILLGIFLLSFFSMMQLGAASLRKNLLSTFCVNNQTVDGGFVDTNGSTDGMTEFTTFANLYILHQIDEDFDMLLNADLLRARSWLNESQKQIDKPRLNIPAGFYAFYAANFTLDDEDYNSTLIENGKTNILELQNQTTYGFASNQSSTTTIIDTYYAIKFLTLTDGLGAINQANVANYILTCQDENSSLFSSVPEGTPSLIDTYYGLATLNLLNESIDLYVDTDAKAAISTYVDSYYCDDDSNYDHYGGYSVTLELVETSILITYYSVNIMNLIGGTVHEETFDWILDRQSSIDYGFQDVYTSKTGGASSAKLSYYAVEIILSFEPTAFNRNGVMGEEIWDLHTSGWIVALIVLLCLVGIAGIGFGVWKYKNRI